MQANEAYRLLPMPVPAVIVTLHGAEGGLLLDEDTGKEVGTVVLLCMREPASRGFPPRATNGLFLLVADNRFVMLPIIG